MCVRGKRERGRFEESGWRWKSIVFWMEDVPLHIKWIMIEYDRGDLVCDMIISIHMDTYLIHTQHPLLKKKTKNASRRVPFFLR